MSTVRPVFSTEAFDVLIAAEHSALAPVVSVLVRNADLDSLAVFLDNVFPRLTPHQADQVRFATLPFAQSEREDLVAFHRRWLAATGGQDGNLLAQKLCAIAADPAPVDDELTNVRRLLTEGARLDAPVGRDRRTAVGEAIAHKNGAVLDLLLAHAAKQIQAGALPVARGRDDAIRFAVRYALTREAHDLPLSVVLWQKALSADVLRASISKEIASLIVRPKPSDITRDGLRVIVNLAASGLVDQATLQHVWRWNPIKSRLDQPHVLGHIATRSQRPDGLQAMQAALDAFAGAGCDLNAVVANDEPAIWRGRVVVGSGRERPSTIPLPVLMMLRGTPEGLEVYARAGGDLAICQAYLDDPAAPHGAPPDAACAYLRARSMRDYMAQRLGSRAAP